MGESHRALNYTGKVQSLDGGQGGKRGRSERRQAACLMNSPNVAAIFHSKWTKALVPNTLFHMPHFFQQALVMERIFKVIVSAIGFKMVDEGPSRHMLKSTL